MANIFIGIKGTVLALDRATGETVFRLWPGCGPAGQAKAYPTETCDMLQLVRAYLLFFGHYHGNFGGDFFV